MQMEYLSFKKHALADRVFTLMLIYRKQMLQYLLAKIPIDIIAGAFNRDLSNVSQNKFLDIFTDHVQW